VLHTEEAMRFAEQARARRAGIKSIGIGGAGIKSTDMTAPDPAALDPRVPPAYIFSPCPNNDFNGANFMYFATFAALADRAEWHFVKPEPLLTVASREVFYYGNVNVGEDVAVHLTVSQPVDGNGLRHRCLIVRLADGCAIAEVLTHKRPSRNTDHD
jgi:probable biosynthetic protein (TIGR04099 family)